MTLARRKVHPYPAAARRQTMVVVYDVEAANNLTQSAIPSPAPTSRLSKKLKRMPHLFAKVLELPFDSDTQVEVQERSDCFVFEVLQSGLVAQDLRVQVLEIVPGAVKVVIGEQQRSQLRFRLPASTSPEATRVEYQDDVKLVVTIPKLEYRFDVPAAV